MKTNRFVLWFLSWWPVATTLKIDKVQVIVSIGYTTRFDRLTIATEAILKKSLQFLTFTIDTRIGIASCGYPFKGAEKMEHERKIKLITDCGVSPRRILSVSDINNSVDEALKLRKEFELRGVPPGPILIVTGPLHSRSALYIYKRVFPEREIYVRHGCEWYEEFEPGHLVRCQQTASLWIMANIKRQIAVILAWSILRAYGFCLLSRLHHRAVK